jgi:hypothetical protein
MNQETDPMTRTITKAEAIMRDIDIAASRRLRGLGERQRLELLRVI